MLNLCVSIRFWCFICDKLRIDDDTGYDGFKMILPPRCSMFVKTNIGLQTPTHHPPEIQDQSSLFCYEVNKFSKGRTFSSIISMCGHEWVKKIKF